MDRRASLNTIRKRERGRSDRQNRMAMIEIKEVSKIFGSRIDEAQNMLRQGASKEEILKKTGATIGVDRVSLRINKGEFFVIMGLSGSGKSTLIRLLNRLIEPTEGDIIIDGQKITALNSRQLREFRRKKMSMVFQRFALFPHRTVLKNIEYGLEIQGVPKKEREEKALRALASVGLQGYEQAYPDQLSGGMQQRVGLARALANDPDILLMDEAFSALDPLIRDEMQDELLELQEKLNKTIVFITHDLDEALKLGDRIGLMKDGKLIQVGTPEEILTDPADDYVARFVEKVDRSKVLLASHVMKKPDVIVTEKDGPRVAIRKMEEEEISSIFVVGRNRMLKGLLTIDAALEAAKHNEPIEEKLIFDFPITSPDTPLHELIPIAAETKYPIAVVEEGQLKGIIVRVSVLSGLILGKSNGGEE